jgi:gliding motility-associated-like protein
MGNSQDLIGVPAENYTVQVTDNNGCVKSLNRTITQPLVALSVTIDAVDVLCFGDNTGAIDLSVSGGTPPYSFSWSSGQSTEDISNILAGNYSFTIVDANGCPFNGNVVISEPSQPLAVINTISDVNCFGESNGVIDLTVSGGTPGYSFEWSSSSFQLSATSEDLVNYIADDYRYEVTDMNGCKSIDTLTISEPPLLVSAISGVNILCKGESTGSVDLTVTGGAPTYVFAWNNGAISEDLVNLPAGVYEVLITDSQGCETENAIELTEPTDSLRYDYDVVNVKCNDGTDGEIELFLTGGTLPYNIGWSNGATTNLIDGLTAGYYEFLVTDNNGCTVTDSIEIDQPDAVTLNEVISDVSCNGLSDGIIDISPSGGTAPYTYTWFNSDFALSAQTQDLIDFPADTYQLEILDTNNCFYEMFLEIEEPDSIVIEYTFSIVSCSDGADASITVAVTGGTPAYNFDWSNGATTQNLNNIPADVYELNLTDANGCEDSIKVEIVQPEPIEVTFETTIVSCKDQFDGTALASATGGNGGYQYYWDNGTSVAFNEQLTSDWHYVEVVDILGCDKADSVFVDANPIGCIDPVNTFSPNDDNYNDTWVIDNVSLYPNIKMHIYNKWGNLIFKEENGYTPWDGKFNGKVLPAGVYFFILELGDDENEVLKGNITLIK